MRVVRVVAEGMLQVRMRSRLQFTVEQEMPFTAVERASLVKLEAPAPAHVQEIVAEAAPAVEPAVLATAPSEQPAQTPKRGIVISWPSNLSAKLRRMKVAMSPGANSEALNLFEAPNRP